MNERIKELAEQAKFAMNVSNDPNSPPSWWAAGHNDTFEKFAELIVKECAKSANDWYQNHDKIHSDPMSYVLAHFGVEE